MYSSIYSLQSSTQRLPIRALFGFTLKQSSPIPPFLSESPSVVVCPRFCLGLPHTKPGDCEALQWLTCDTWASRGNEELRSLGHDQRQLLQCSLQHNTTYIHSTNTYYNAHCNVHCNITLHTYEHLLQYPLQHPLQHNTTYIQIPIATPIATPIAMFVANIIPHTYEHLLQYLLQCLLQHLYFVDSVTGQGVRLGRLCITKKVT